MMYDTALGEIWHDIRVLAHFFLDDPLVTEVAEKAKTNSFLKHCFEEIDRHLSAGGPVPFETKYIKVYSTQPYFGEGDRYYVLEGLVHIPRGELADTSVGLAFLAICFNKHWWLR